MIVITRDLARRFRAVARKCVSDRPHGPAPPVVMQARSGTLTLLARTGDADLTYTGPTDGGDAAALLDALPHLPGTGGADLAVTLDLDGWVVVRAKGAETGEVREVALTRSPAAGPPARAAVDRKAVAEEGVSRSLRLTTTPRRASVKTHETNGRPQRKQLADQIDRLDQLLDGLADGLNDAIADAAREGTRQAVKEVIVEILTNPDLRALVGGHAAPAPTAPAAPAVPANPAPSRPSLWSRIKEKVAAIKAAVTGSISPVVTEVSDRCRAARETVASAVSALGTAWQLKKIVLIGLGVGLATAAVAYLAPHALSAAAAGVGGAVTAVAAQPAAWLRRSARRTLGLA
ncbi:MAG TPA: hypothetical protein VFG68_18195 [Fimbriiglobus sp.]|nr:hypothetical protein [Fimbriiglobus sp.]